MNESFSLTGGARIGRANATFPFASLFVDKGVLKINASIIGKLVFQPQDIISIEPYGRIPFIGKGIKINHRIKTYNSTVIFWTPNPELVIKEIEKVGFLNNINNNISFDDSVIIQRQEQGSFPVKKPAAITLIVIWNLLILSDFIAFFLGHKQEGLPLGMGVKLALSLLVSISIATLVSDDFRKMILKEGTELNDIKKFVYFIILIAGSILSFSIVFDFNR